MMKRTMLILALVGAVSACDKLGEIAIEKATGVEVDKDGKKVTIQTEEGKVTMTTDGTGKTARTVVTTEDGEKTAVMNAEDNKIKITTEDGTLTLGEQKVPDDFPLPVIAHDKVMTSAHATKAGKDTYSLMLQTKKAPGEVADFYQKALEGKGVKVKRMEHKMNDDVMINLGGEGDKVNAGVNVMRKGGEALTQVMIHWNPKK